MIELETTILEDNKEYAIIDIIEIDGIKYIYLSAISDIDTKKQVCIRKELNEEEIIGLDNEEEYQKALQAFVNKYKEVIS